jgi:hypothetical protein
MNHDLVKLALEHCGTTEFERFSQTVIGAVVGPTFKALGGVGDGGADGFVDADILEDTARPSRFFQASKQLTVETKIRGTVARLREVGRDVRMLFFASSQAVPYLDKLQHELGEELDIGLRIYDRNFFIQHSADDNNVEAAVQTYLRPAVTFLEDIKAPSFPNQPAFGNAQAVSAFLSHELERRIGTTRTLEAVCDALIIWALEETDPEMEILMGEADILAKVEGVIPTARKFLRSQIGTRLKDLTKKNRGVRTVNIYAKKGAYCLPYETRKHISESLVADEKMKLDVTDNFRARLMATNKDKLDGDTLEKIPPLLHKTLETLFQVQGYNAVRHFSDNMDADALDARAVVDIANELVAQCDISPKLHAIVAILMKEVLRQVLYASDPVERTYCGRLARTYVLLFTMKNTPELIEYFNSMANNFVLYVGSDIIVRAISEFYLAPEDQMTVNALKIIRQSGSRLIMSEATLDEVHSHIYASDREYAGTYAEVDQIVDRDLASESDRILIRAYYYAKLNRTLSNPPTSWGMYLGNFLSWSRMSGPTSPQSMKSLKDTLVSRFGFEFEDREDMIRNIDSDELKQLTKKIQELRKDQGRRHEEIRAENDALHILRVLERRRQEEKAPSNPYGYRAWWLTQETKSGVALTMAFPKRRGVRPIMRPEFLINYIAYNPTSKEVKKSLASIFPSILGVRLGTRLEDETFKKVMKQIKLANQNDPSRAQAIVVEHSDALKAQDLRDFSIKYSSPI